MSQARVYVEGGEVEPNSHLSLFVQSSAKFNQKLQTNSAAPLE